MVYKHRMQNGKIRHYSSKNAYERSLRGMFANGYQKKNHSRKIRKTKPKKRMQHHGVKKVSSKGEYCKYCKKKKHLTEGSCKDCAEAFASYKQPEAKNFPHRKDIIEHARLLDSNEIGEYADTRAFKEHLYQQIKTGALEEHSAWVESVGREAAIKSFETETWGDMYFAVFAYQNGDNFAFVENRVGDRFVLIRNANNDHLFNQLENGKILEADSDNQDNIDAFFWGVDSDIIIFDFYELRNQGRRVY